MARRSLLLLDRGRPPTDRAGAIVARIACARIPLWLVFHACKQGSFELPPGSQDATTPRAGRRWRWVSRTDTADGPWGDPPPAPLLSRALRGGPRSARRPPPPSRIRDLEWVGAVSGSGPGPA